MSVEAQNNVLRQEVSNLNKQVAVLTADKSKEFWDAFWPRLTNFVASACWNIGALACASGGAAALAWGLNQVGKAIKDKEHIKHELELASLKHENEKQLQEQKLRQEADFKEKELELKRRELEQSAEIENKKLEQERYLEGAKFKMELMKMCLDTCKETAAQDGNAVDAQMLGDIFHMVNMANQATSSDAGLALAPRARSPRAESFQHSDAPSSPHGGGSSARSSGSH